MEVYAEEVTFQPSDPSNNEVEVNESNYKVNVTKTNFEENDYYSDIHGSYGENK